MPRNWHDFTVLDIGKRKSEVMKIQGFQKTGFTAALAAAIFTANVFGQATTPETTPPPLVPNTPATSTPYLSPATAQVLQLTQAKVSDTTIMAYVQNSTTMYGLNADQIIYLKQQGVSDGVLNAMLNQSSRVAASIAAQTPPSNYGQDGQNPAPDQSSTAVVQPTTAAPSSVYVVPDSSTAGYNSWAAQYSYPYNYYPYYYSYPYYPYYYWPVGFSFYYGGYRGGYYRPGYGWHGGNWNGGWHGGTWGGGGVHTGGTWNGGGSHGMGGGGGSFHSGGSMGGGMGGGGHR
jgi:hypothetical protein